MRLMNRNKVGWLGVFLMVLGLTQVAALQLGLRTADEIVRATPRLLSAGEAVCTALQTARDKRNGR